MNPVGGSDLHRRRHRPGRLPRSRRTARLQAGAADRGRQVVPLRHPLLGIAAQRPRRHRPGRPWSSSPRSRGPSAAPRWQVQVADGLLVEGHRAHDRRRGAGTSTTPATRAFGSGTSRDPRSPVAARPLAERRSRRAPQPLRRWPLRTRGGEQAGVTTATSTSSWTSRTPGPGRGGAMVPAGAVRRGWREPGPGGLAARAAVRRGRPGLPALRSGRRRDPRRLRRDGAGSWCRGSTSAPRSRAGSPCTRRCRCPDGQLLLVNTEAIAEMSEEPYNFAGIVDIQRRARRPDCSR